jgi:predicted RND superfamily exporter protein
MQRTIQTAARHPWWVLCVTAILTIAAFSQLSQFQFESSNERMIIDNKQQAFAEYAQTGDSSDEVGIVSKIRADQKLVLPLSVLVLLITLGLIMRRPSAVIIPMMTAGLSIVWTAGLMAALGIPISALTAVAPALIIIVGSTEDIHLITEYQAALQRGASHRHALMLMAKHKSTAVSLTFATTCVGFLSIALNRIDLLTEFGLITAAGLLFNFLITITLVPVCVQWCKRYAVRRPGVRTAIFENWASQISDFTFQHSQTIIETLLGTLVVCAIWATHAEISNNAMDYFNPASSLFLMMLMIFFLVAVLFNSLKAGMVAVVANLFPIVVLFGALGLFSIPLDAGTMMVSAISMGIGVNHTIHFLMRYQHLANQGLKKEKIIRKVMRMESTPIMATAFALSMGFATLAFSNFPSIARFGMLSAMVMLLALISTFVIIPLMMRTYQVQLRWRSDTKTVNSII